MDTHMARFLLGSAPAQSRTTTPARAMRLWLCVLMLGVSAAIGYWLLADPDRRDALRELLVEVSDQTVEAKEDATLLPPPPPQQSSARHPFHTQPPAPPHAATIAAETATMAGKTNTPPAHNGVRAAPAVAPTPAAEAAAIKKLRHIDKLIAKSNLPKARELLEAFAQAPDVPDRYIADAYYRLGLIARREKREEDALGNWDRAYSAFPTSPGGRLAALALADTRFVSACGNTPDYDQWEEIRDLYSTAIGMDGAPFLTDAAARARVIRNLTTLNDRLVFSPAPVKGAIFHTVKGGEVLYTIARKHHVHFESIARINRIQPNRLRKGRVLKILKAECLVVVDKSALTLTWYLNGKWVKRYPCCVGPANKTPAGTYTITRKDEKPAWRNPADGRLYDYGDPKNILGTRWLAIEGNGTEGLGIHGTTKPESIPGRTSNGCVRLNNKDVEELYGFALVGSQVIIRD